ncbi:MAG: Glycosyl transferase group 1 [Candidatus Collierbacteria bacterium GW2011_GWB1_44_6]|uniref:Glycosyl transferase group 1 n=1 Tax=Candidatus Collierbacteria bacterium GW2011_GWB1_44_6 TaxID=1618384 RepID=A0A0G1JKS0_9BACT|nr:MAG: Glycosyl transferase group 1 [Candidatus Moranbacteria bacterium GW2011_GWC2_40_12]KKT71978.1 MAG: Glycosyl transferase group 1 [Candidatus Collierbacteria bacterium GW2011_GWB1_44_6]KKT81391.1 MAG: Glycosyl transferase group 1 [Microgenomates group bacterium GW2011_GWC1_44_9]
MKIALVYDRINKFGGAERLLLALHRIYPEAPIFTLVHDPTTSKWAEGINIIPSFINKVSPLRQKHEWLAPLAPLAFESLDFSGYDVIISITSSDAKSVITKPGQLHICYCLTPTRYFWSGEKEYSADHKLKIIPSFIKNYFKSVDLLTSTRPDEYISISFEVQERVKKYYNRESIVVYPPIEDKFYANTPIDMDNREYFLVIGRMVPYKKFDLVIKAFNILNKPLVVIGTGSQLENLKKMAGPTTSFVGHVEDHRLVEYYRRARAVIFPQKEDFGLVPLEAQALGTPVIAYSKGGALETIAENKTGIFFSEQTEESLLEAVKRFEKMKFSIKDCTENASKFSFSVFSEKFSKQISDLWSDHLSNFPA